MFHSPGNKDEATFSDDIFLILEPELDFGIQIVRILPVTAHESQNFIKIVGMGYLHLYWFGTVLIPEPDAIKVKGSLEYTLVQR